MYLFAHRTIPVFDSLSYFSFKRMQCTQVFYSYTNESQVLTSKWQMFCNSRRIHRQDLGLHNEGARLLLSPCVSY